MKPIDELTDKELDYWCAKAQNLDIRTWTNQDRIDAYLAAHDGTKYEDGIFKWVNENLYMYSEPPTDPYKDRVGILYVIPDNHEPSGYAYEPLVSFIYCPTTNKAQAFELIERCNVAVMRDGESWQAWVMYEYEGKPDQFADTPQRAICRAVVASKYGEKVDKVQ